MAIEDGQPELFTATWTQTWHNFIKPFLPSNILVFILLLGLGYLAGGPVVAVVLPVLVIGGIIGLMRVASTGNRVRVSGYGIEVLSRGRLVGLRWADITQVVVLDKKRSGVIAPYGVARASAGASAGLFADANTGPGLLGQGTVLDPQRAGTAMDAGPHWLEEQAQQVPVKMFLMVVDRDWPTGRIGEWVRRYRPDLFAATSPR